MRSLSGSHAAAAVLAAASLSHAQQTPYSIDTPDDIRTTAATVAFDLMGYYKGNQSNGQIPGILPGPPPAGDYYWWEGGALWGTMIDYWSLTGDNSYNDVVIEAMLHQIGDNKDYQPDNVTLSLGNDDQAFWGMSAMLAAENGFPNPPDDQPGWLALAQAVFNTQAAPGRHDDACGGGLRWQIPFSNNGYDYKNSIANGCFFNLGARLARYSDNETYAKWAADWAEETWDWVEGVKYIDPETYAIYDGAHVPDNCTIINEQQFSYNNAVFALGAAYMYNYTDGSEKWETRLNKLLDHGLEFFFSKDVMKEVSCEDYNTCTTDMKSFKGYVHRWYSTITQIAPKTAPRILPVLKKSTEAAVKQCTGGELGRECGFKWASGKFDNDVGAGQQMNVLGAVSSLLIGESKGPVSAGTGGTSKGDTSAGSDSKDNFEKHHRPITTGDRAGAGVITFVLLSAACGMFGWMSTGNEV